MTPEEQIAFMEEKINILRAAIEASTEHDDTSKYCLFCTISESLQSLASLSDLEEEGWEFERKHWEKTEKYFLKKGINLDHFAKYDSNYKRKWKRGKKY
jgi:hypothetical protein